MTQRRRQTLWLSVAVALIPLAGCTSSEIAAEPTPSPLSTAQPGPADVPAADLELPTSPWRVGDPAEQALLRAPLSVDGRCLVAGSTEYPTAVVWPAGFTASIDATGAALVRNAANLVVTASGEEIRAGGGFGAADEAPWNRMPCVGKYSDVFVIQDSMDN